MANSSELEKQVQGMQAMQKDSMQKGMSAFGSSNDRTALASGFIGWTNVTQDEKLRKKQEAALEQQKQ